MNPGNKALVVYSVLPDRSVFDFTDGLSNAELDFSTCYCSSTIVGISPQKALLPFPGQIHSCFFISYSFSFKMS